MLARLRLDRFKYTPLALHETQYNEVQSPSSFGFLRSAARVPWLRYILGLLLSSLTALIAFIAYTRSGSHSALQVSKLRQQQLSNGAIHPISYLVDNANDTLNILQAQQSTTLEMAIDEYWRRNSMPPPPLFDKWYDFAMEQGTELIDEFDEINQSLELFWGIEPSLIRRRTREILGQNNKLMGATIRNGKVNIVGKGQGVFQAEATREVLSAFSQWLPDMDLAFNVNDEPRVLVPHEDAERLRLSASGSRPSSKATKNSFSTTHDLGDGTVFKPFLGDLFTHLDHQQIWSHARMPCPPDSPARSLDPDQPDAKLGLTIEGITFLNNITAFTDICLSPSVQNSIGLLNKPNALSISHELLPIFSPSKLSTFQDILYPSMYYYARLANYDESYAVPWHEKSSKLYWRGATSGGYSKDGSWRTLLRQSILSKLRPEGTTQVLQQPEPEIDSSAWTGHSVNRSTVSDRYDVQFTEIKQCEPAACNEMRQFFGSHGAVPQEAAWQNRYLLDMDGNALSGRFYAFLESLSLPLKVAYFREWHMSRIIPWKHYVPLTSTTDEYDEVLRFFEDEEEGRRIAKALAFEGHEWMKRVAGKRDMQVYMFRLLLE